jgi:hypothetical protein
MLQTVVPMIHVPDVSATVNWYTSIGFKVVRRNEEDGETNWRSCHSETAKSCSTQAGDRARTTVARSTCT